MTPDTGLSCLLEYHRYPMPDSGMFSLPIVVRLDVFKDTGLGHAPSNVSFSVNEFDFQCVKEALHRRIVIAGRSASHAAAQNVRSDQLLISP